MLANTGRRIDMSEIFIAITLGRMALFSSSHVSVGVKESLHTTEKAKRRFTRDFAGSMC
jgi:hypothetical protein